MEAVGKIGVIGLRKNKVRTKKIIKRRKEAFLTRFFILSFILTVVIIFGVAQKAIITQQSFIMEDLKKQIDAEKLLNERLKIKVASLTSPERIEEIALNQLGMILPADVRYVYLQENEEKVVESQVAINIKNKKDEPSYNVWADLGKKVSKLETFLKVPNGFSSSL